jgi:Spy/CpxP family protein refolding chaperone
MKKSFTALAVAVALVVPLSSVAQVVPATMSSAELRGKIQSDKKGIIQRNLPLTDKEAAKFWPLYETFEKELAGPQAQINRAIIDFVNAGSAISDANAKRMAEQVLKAQTDEAKLRQAQFSKVLKVLPGAKAARYMQLENKMRSVMLYETALAIPLVP